MAPWAVIIVAITVISLPALLKLWRHRAVGVAPTVSNIDVGAVAASDGMSTVASTVTSAAAMIVLPRSLFLRREGSVRITHAVSGAQIPTVAAWRRVSWHTILDLLDGWLNQPRHGRAHK